MKYHCQVIIQKKYFYESFYAGLWKKIETPLTIKFERLSGGKRPFDSNITVYKNYKDKRSEYLMTEKNNRYSVVHRCGEGYTYEFYLNE